MTTKTLEKEVNKLKQEVIILRSLVISIVQQPKKDPEGEYKPEFVRSVLKAMKEPATHTFTNGKDFLKLLQAK
jgi:hypothetical protein